MNTDQICLNVDCRTIDPATLGHHVLGTDPPYSEHTHAGMTSCTQRGDAKGVRHRDAGFASLSPELRAYLVEAARHAKRWSLIYTDDRGLGAWIEGLDTIAREKTRGGYIRTVSITPDSDELGETDGGHVATFPWVRWSSPQQSKDRPPTGCEFLALAHAPGLMRWGGPGNLTSLRHACERSWGPKARDLGQDKHTTAKPLDQCLDLVAWHSDPGDLWFDPCAGRFTFGVACALLGRDYVGCEIDAHEAELGAERVRLAREGVLGPRDHDRFERWAKSIGWTSVCGIHSFQGARFVKGLVAA